MLAVSNLSKSFGDKLVLDNLSRNFEAGRIYGLVGSNGAGKSTFFRCLAGLTNYSGKIEYVESGLLKNQIGYLPTEPYLMPKITGLEYLAFCLKARGLSLSKLRGYNLFDLPLANYAEKYSTGMKKQLAITAILLQKNTIFVLDEPFNGIDLENSLLIKALILALKAQQKIVILASHSLSMLTSLCDEIDRLEKGKLTQTYLPAQFFSLEKMLESQVNQAKLSEFL